MRIPRLLGGIVGHVYATVMSLMSFARGAWPTRSTGLAQLA